MATRKPKAAPTAVKARNTARAAKTRNDDFEVPEGFDDVTTVYANLPPWDFDTNPTLKGTVNKVDDATVEGKDGKRETQVAHVITEDGEEVALWNSAGLSELFDVLVKGSRIVIHYTGMEELKKGKRMRTFRSYHRAP